MKGVHHSFDLKIFSFSLCNNMIQVLQQLQMQALNSHKRVFINLIKKIEFTHEKKIKVKEKKEEKKEKLLF